MSTPSQTKYISKETCLDMVTRALSNRGVKIVEDPSKIDNLSTPSELKAHFEALNTNKKEDEKVPKKKKKGYKKKIEFTDEELNSAMLDLVYPDLLPILQNYPRTQQYWCDPVYSGQVFCLHSFIPSKGAQPDKDGIYGMIKCRGTFNTEEDMDRRSEQIIRDVDSCHMLYQGYTGKPFPLTTDEKYCREIKEIDIKDQMKEIIRQDMKSQKEKDENEQKEKEERRQELLKRIEDEKKGTPDMLELYTQLRVKRANMIFSIVDMDMQRKKQVDALRECIKDISTMDDKYPTYQTQFEDKYKQACDDVGIQNNTMAKYLVGDVPFDI